MITPWKIIKTNYETQFSMNSMLNEKFKRIQLKKTKKKLLELTYQTRDLSHQI
jgi:hypothetical protein